MRQAIGRRGVLAVVALGIASCGVDAGGSDGGITVLAAASLADAFDDVGAAFAMAHPETTVRFSFGASSALGRQIIEGAPADVYAAADRVTMDRLVDADLTLAEPVRFATNRLAMIVAPGNPEDIREVEDLANPDLDVVICAREVPCGRYAIEVFDAAGVTVEAASHEPSVRGVTAKVTEGEADAGIVYVTDAVAAGEAATMVPIPEADNVVAEYPIATVASSDEPESARAFIDFVTGAEGRTILAEHGFGQP